MNHLVSIEESIKRILETPLGSRVMLPEFGSKLYTLIDKRLDQAWRLMFISYVFEALKRWEPRIRLRRAVPKTVNDNGEIIISLEMEIKATNETYQTEVIYATA